MSPMSYQLLHPATGERTIPIATLVSTINVGARFSSSGGILGGRGRFAPTT
jgi:hypothetical protein